MFDSFTSLKGLSFYNTTLTKVDENLLTRELGSHLQDLYLKHNNIRILSASAFQNMFKLESLNLGENQAIGRMINNGVFTKSLINLNNLSLGNCNITTLNDDVFINVT